METAQKTLFLKQENIKSSLITGENGETLYISDTNEWRMYDLTTIRRPSGDAIAKVEWHSTSQERVTLGCSSSKIKLGQFLEEVMVSDNERMGCFRDESNRSYRWKGIDGDSHRTLTVYADDTDEKIAEFKPAVTGPEARCGILRLNCRRCELEELIVLSLLIIQRARRKYKGSWTKGKDEVWENVGKVGDILGSIGDILGN